MTLPTNIAKSNQGYVIDNQRFMLVATVKNNMSGTFESITNITNSTDKCFILCSNTLEDGVNTVLYFSNDPNDFIPNFLKTGNNYGFTPVFKKDNLLYFDILRNNHDITIPLQANCNFQVDSHSNNLINLNYTYQGQYISYADLNYGQPLSITLDNGDNIPFYIRTNKSSGEIGPSIAYFSKSSTVFEYQKTVFYSSYGTSFTYNSNINNQLGVSLLTVETAQGSENFNAIPYNGIIELKQGTSVWYDIFNNFGVSDIYLSSKITTGTSFLNREVFEPNINVSGISVKINLRNNEENFVSIPNISTSEEVFDYYLINLQGFISGGINNNSSQYHLNNGDVQGGICYYPNRNYTDINFFRYSITQGFLNAINTINGSSITIQTIDNNKLKTHHAGPNTVYATHYDSLHAIDFSQFNNYSNTSDCNSNSRIIPRNIKNICGLYINSNNI